MIDLDVMKARWKEGAIRNQMSCSGVEGEAAKDIQSLLAWVEELTNERDDLKEMVESCCQHVVKQVKDLEVSLDLEHLNTRLTRWTAAFHHIVEAGALSDAVTARRVMMTTALGALADEDGRDEP